MWHLRAFAVIAVAVPLAIGAGCVSQSKYNTDVMSAQTKTAAAQKQLDQAKKDLKSAQDKLVAITQSLPDLKAAQKEAADQKDRADRLQAQLAEVQKTCDRVQEDLAAEKTKVVQLQRMANMQQPPTDELKAAREQLAAAQAQLAATRAAIAEIAKSLVAAMPAAQQAK